MILTCSYRNKWKEKALYTKWIIIDTEILHLNYNGRNLDTEVLMKIIISLVSPVT